MRDRSNSFALPVSLIYGLVASAYILLSDRVVAWLVPDAITVTHFQTFKGLVFVVTTTVLLDLVTRRQLGRWLQEHDRRQVAESAQFLSDQKMRAIFDLSFEFMGLLRKDGTLVEANRSALEFGRVEAGVVVVHG